MLVSQGYETIRVECRELVLIKSNKREEWAGKSQGNRLGFLLTPYVTQFLQLQSRFCTQTTFSCGSSDKHQSHCICPGSPVEGEVNRAPATHFVNSG